MLRRRFQDIRAAVERLHRDPDLTHGATPPRLGPEFLLILLTGAVVVTLHYHGRFWVFRDKVLPKWIEAGQIAMPWTDVDFAGHAWQGVAALALYAVIPMTVACVLLRRSPAHFGCYVEGRTLRALGWAAVAFVAAVPVLWLASGVESVSATWPQYRTPLAPDSAWAKAAPGLGDYFLVHLTWIVAVEVLFRGVLLFSLHRRFGHVAIAVAALPYGTLLFDLPMGMTVLAFVGGCVLGWIALVGRSLLPCILLHWAVATTLDVFCVWQLGLDPFALP